MANITIDIVMDIIHQIESRLAKIEYRLDKLEIKVDSHGSFIDNEFFDRKPSIDNEFFDRKLKR